jgi:hypothetical protein
MIAENLSEDSPDNYYRWDTSAVPQGTYYVYATIENSFGKSSSDYSDGVVVIEHDSRPVVQVLAPRVNQDAADASYTIQWIAHDQYSATGSVSIWHDNNNSGYNGSPIVEDIPNQSGSVQSYVWNTTLVPEAQYWIYVTVDDGVNQAVSDYGSGSVAINHAPVVGFTTPNALQEAPNSSKVYRIQIGAAAIREEPCSTFIGIPIQAAPMEL